MSGTVWTILAVQISAPCSPCMNWLNRHASIWRRASPFSLSVILSHHGGAEQRVDVVGHADRVLRIDLERPVEPVGADPLATGPLVVQPEQLLAPVGVVEVEHRRGRTNRDPPRLGRLLHRVVGLSMLAVSVALPLS